MRDEDGYALETENETLRLQNAELRSLLKETMFWIDSWEPEFIFDPDWKAFDLIVRAVIVKATGGE